jgi:hypothetical protein
MNFEKPIFNLVQDMEPVYSGGLGLFDAKLGTLMSQEWSILHGRHI